MFRHPAVVWKRFGAAATSFLREIHFKIGIKLKKKKKQVNICFKCILNNLIIQIDLVVAEIHSIMINLIF